MTNEEQLFNYRKAVAIAKVALNAASARLESAKKVNTGFLLTCINRQISASSQAQIDAISATTYQPSKESE